MSRANDDLSFPRWAGGFWECWADVIGAFLTRFVVLDDHLIHWAAGFDDFAFWGNDDVVAHLRADRREGGFRAVVHPDQNVMLTIHQRVGGDFGMLDLNISAWC